MYNRILKRPMFKMGGRSYSAQGTGITSGLDTPKRGLVDGPGGYAGEERLTEIAEEKINVTQPRESEGMRVLRSFGEYANPYNERGEALTIGQVGKRQADKITAERDAQYALEQAGQLENLDAESVKINKDLDRSADQLNAMEIQALINSKEIEIDKRYKAVDRKYDIVIDQLNDKIKNGTYAEGETKEMVEDLIRKKEQERAQDKYDIAKRTPVKPTKAELVDALAFMIYESSNKNLGPGQEGKTLAKAKEEALEYYGITSKAKGGRVGYNMGTGMDGAQPMQASMNMEETISTPNETVTEDVSMTETMDNKPAVDMPYAEFRGKIPPEVDDGIVQLIYYNKDAFADFASIVDQSGVEEFNNKYQVSLILPMSDAMV